MWRRNEEASTALKPANNVGEDRVIADALRKSRCDGQVPRCARCRNANEECTYGVGDDKRRPLSRAYVKALETRVAVLEGLLETLSQNPLTGVSNGARSAVVGDQTQQLASASNLANTDRLTLDEQSHELHHYGPSSTLQHVAETPLSDPIIPSPQYDPWTRSHVKSQLVWQVQTGYWDWRRHLPALDDWDDELHTALLQLYFDSNQFYHIVDETNFQQHMQVCLANPSGATPGRSAHYSPVLHNAMLAVACQLSDDTRANSQEVFASLLRASQHELFVEGDRPTLSTVQGVLLIANFFTCVGKHRLGYFYAGIAIRMCHTLGLGLDCSALVRRGLLSEADRRARDRTLRVCYVFDKLWSSYMGHDPSLRQSAFEISLKDEAEDQNTDLSLFNYTCQLAVIQEKVMRAVYSPNVVLDTPMSLDAVTALGVELDLWFESIPSAVRILPQCVKPLNAEAMTLNIYFHFVKILLYRMYVRGSRTCTITRHAEERCQSAASRISAIMGVRDDKAEAYDQLYDRSVGLSTAPVVLVQFACMAASVQLDMGALASDKRRLANRGDLLVIINYLRSVGRPYGASIQHCEMLAKMMQDRSRRGQENGDLPPPDHPQLEEFDYDMEAFISDLLNGTSNDESSRYGLFGDENHLPAFVGFPTSDWMEAFGGGVLPSTDSSWALGSP